MTETILIAGTASHVGKSTVAAGLCRRLADRGLSVAPFKAQNMSNNARAALRRHAVRGGERTAGRAGDGPLAPDAGADDARAAYGEIGVSQYVQARAAGVTPTTDLNPVLLKPRGDGESQLVVDGRPVGHYEAGTYYDSHWETARRAAVAAHERLAAEHDVIVAEGAGGAAEINLHDRDLANVETARFADASILLVTDIDRGGAFASLYGTLELMPADLRERVRGAVITKFRGDERLLAPGVEELERRTGVPVLDVIPHDDPGLPAEDSVSLPDDGVDVRGADDGVPAADAVTIAVPRLPRISNFTDLEPLARESGVRVAYLPLEADLADADAVVLPGTKNAVDDLLAAREAGLDEALGDFEGPIVGVCGGYQLLGRRLRNAAREGTGDRDVVEGFGVLPVETRFARRKRIEPVERRVEGSGPIAGASGTVKGYEIHAGRTAATGPVDRPIGPDSAATDAALGTYLHGLFENESIRSAFVDATFRAAGRGRPTSSRPDRSPYERAADLIAGVDLDALL